MTPMAQDTDVIDPAIDPYGALEHGLRIIIRRSQSNATALARRVHPDLEPNAYPLLAHIYMYPRTRGSDLAAHFGVGRATISRQLSRLEKLGLITRAADPDDTRGQLITLTKDGNACVASAREGRTKAIEHALADWGSDDVAELARLLHRFSAEWVEWSSARPISR